MVIGRNRPDPTKKTQQFGAAAASYSPRRSRRSNSIGRLVIVAARCDMGGAPLCAWQPQLEYPLPRLTQNPLRHLESLPLALLHLMH